MAEYRCGECGKVYKSKGWLRRHQKQVHAKDGLVSLPLDSAGGRQGAEVSALGPVEALEPKVLERALVDLGIEPDNVMAHQVYPDRVVIIEGPAGFKRVWMMPGGVAGSGDRAVP